MREIPITDMDQVYRDVKRARKWARKEFNTSGPDGLLDPPAFDVIVHAHRPDCIVVYLRSHGKRLWPGITFQLIWKGDDMYWRGTNPFTAETWLLKIT